MKRLFNYKYPKLTLLLISIVLAYYIFSSELVTDKLNSFGAFGYLGVIIAGFLFSFGFSTPFAVGFFLTFHTNNIVFTALIGGFGAFLADFLIFKLIKMSFMAEFNSLEKNLKLRKYFHYKFINSKLRLYLTFVLAGIIIASPLPDEFGVALLSGFTRMNVYIFSLISFLMNSFGILILLLIANL